MDANVRRGDAYHAVSKRAVGSKASFKGVSRGVDENAIIVAAVQSRRMVAPPRAHVASSAELLPLILKYRKNQCIAEQKTARISILHTRACPSDASRSYCKKTAAARKMNAIKPIAPSSYNVWEDFLIFFGVRLQLTSIEWKRRYVVEVLSRRRLINTTAATRRTTTNLKQTIIIELFVPVSPVI